MDDLELVKQFLQYVIDDIGTKYPKELEQLTTINLYHRMLEYYLYSKQMNDKNHISANILQPDLKSFKNKIESFIVNHD